MSLSQDGRHAVLHEVRLQLQLSAALLGSCLVRSHSRRFLTRTPLPPRVPFSSSLPALTPVPKPSPTPAITSNPMSGGRDACCEFLASPAPRAHTPMKSARAARVRENQCAHCCCVSCLAWYGACPFVFVSPSAARSYEFAALRSPFYSTSLNFYTLGNRITKADYDKPPAHFSKTVSGGGQRGADAMPLLSPLAPCAMQRFRCAEHLGVLPVLSVYAHWSSFLLWLSSPCVPLSLPLPCAVLYRSRPRSPPVLSSPFPAPIPDRLDDHPPP